MLPIACICIAIAGCAAASGVERATHPGYLERAVSQTEGDVTVTVAALSAEESEAEYGVPLAGKDIQPVWIKMDNRSDKPFWLLYPGIDPNFYPPSEAAEVMSGSDATTESRVALERRFEALAFRNPVEPGESVAGFALTPLHEAVRLVQVDLFASDQSHSFSFITDVPGLRVDYEQTEAIRQRILATTEVIDYTNDDDFRAALTALPCCASNKNGTKNADPLNLVIVGGVEDAFPALIRRGWSPTEVKWFGSVMRMVGSALSRDRYPYAPVSDLYLFGRPQDLALQKARDNIHQRNHLRLWRSTMTYHGKPVWVGQVSRDIGSRLTIHSPTLTTHKIDPDVDEAATALAADLAYSQNLRALGYVGGVGAAPKSAPRHNLTRDPYYTDGRRTVLIFDERPTSLTEIELLPWEFGDSGFLRQTVEGTER